MKMVIIINTLNEASRCVVVGLIVVCFFVVFFCCVGLALRSPTLKNAEQAVDG